MHTTTRLGLDVLDGTDGVNTTPTVDAQVKTILDNAAIYEEGTLVSRPAAGSVAHGTFYWSTDTADLAYNNGSAWLSVAPAAATVGRAYRNAALSLTAGGWSKIPLDTKSFDPGGHFDIATNHRYNVPNSGYYRVDASLAVQLNNNPQVFQIGVYQNGSIVVSGEIITVRGSVNPDTYGLTLSDIVSCNAGDYLELYGYNFGGANVAAVVAGVPTQNSLSVARIA